jgi:hypothetical protein
MILQVPQVAAASQQFASQAIQLSGWQITAALAIFTAAFGSIFSLLAYIWKERKNQMEADRLVQKEFNEHFKIKFSGIDTFVMQAVKTDTEHATKIEAQEKRTITLYSLDKERQKQLNEMDKSLGIIHSHLKLGRG